MFSPCPPIAEAACTAGRVSPRGAKCRGTELAEVFDLLSTTRDALGKVYVSTVQAKRYPFIATQWHPEKNMFEFSSPAMPHSLPAKQLAQAFGNQFVTVRCLSPSGSCLRCLAHCSRRR